MESIKHRVTTQQTIKHSTFITYLIPVETVETAKAHLHAIKADHPGAAHHCMAYLIGDNQEIQKADDDGEPSQTAGVPILEVFKKQAITNVLCVVVRYFGGIKLGAGGLIRAYGSSASSALEQAIRTRKVQYDTYQITAGFDLIGVMENILTPSILIDRAYGDNVTYTVRILNKESAQWLNQIKEATHGKAVVAYIQSESLYE